MNTLCVEPIEAALTTARLVCEGLAGDAEKAERARQPALLREIIGPLPFSPEASLNGWLTPSVLSVARALYLEKSFEGMPVLADALEEAGVTDAEILSHCRGPGPHVRGCWVVDLVLGKS